MTKQAHLEATKQLRLDVRRMRAALRLIGTWLEDDAVEVGDGKWEIPGETFTGMQQLIDRALANGGGK